MLKFTGPGRFVTVRHHIAVVVRKINLPPWPSKSDFIREGSHLVRGNSESVIEGSSPEIDG